MQIFLEIYLSPSFFPVRAGSKHNLRTAMSTETLNRSPRSSSHPGHATSQPTDHTHTKDHSPVGHAHNHPRASSLLTQHNSSSGISSNSSSSSVSPPDSDDCDVINDVIRGNGSDVIMGNGSKKSIVVVGSNGSAAVMSSGSPSLGESSYSLNGGGNFNRSQRSRKYKKEVLFSSGSGTGSMTKAVSIGEKQS